MAYNGQGVVTADGALNQNDRWPFFYRGKQQFFSIFDTIAGTALFSKGLLTLDLNTYYMSYLGYLSREDPVRAMYYFHDGNDRLNEITARLSAEGFEIKLIESDRYQSTRFGFSYHVFELAKSKPN